MYLEIIKNPIVLAVFAGSMTYLYFLWESNKKYKHLKGQKKHDKIKKSISLFIPFVVGAIVGILAYAMFSTSMCDDVDQLTVIETVPDKISGVQTVHTVVQTHMPTAISEPVVGTSGVVTTTVPVVNAATVINPANIANAAKYKFAVGGAMPNVNVDNLSDSINSASYHLISKGMNIPNKPINNANFPDVFIETFD